MARLEMELIHRLQKKQEEQARSTEPEQSQAAASACALSGRVPDVSCPARPCLIQRQAFEELEQVLGINKPASKPTVRGRRSRCAIGWDLLLTPGEPWRGRPRLLLIITLSAHGSHSALIAQSPMATGGASPNAEEAQLSRAFGELDPSGSGRLQTQFVGPLLEKLGLHLNPEQLERAKMQLDPQHTGQVAYRDFVAWWRG